MVAESDKIQRKQDIYLDRYVSYYLQWRFHNNNKLTTSHTGIFLHFSQRYRKLRLRCYVGTFVTFHNACLVVCGQG